MSGDISHTIRKLGHRGPKQVIVAGAGAAALLLASSCSGGAAAPHAAPHPPAHVTITSGNVQFRSAAGGSGQALHAAGSAHPGVQLDSRPDLGVQVTARRGTLTGVTV